MILSCKHHYLNEYYSLGKYVRVDGFHIVNVYARYLFCVKGNDKTIGNI